MKALPSYLAVVPPVGKRFKRPKRQAPKPVPTAVAISEAQMMLRQAEYADTVLRTLVAEAMRGDPVVTMALARHASVEIGALIAQARHAAQRVVQCA
ncbi:hypothetical protein MKK64_11880 [Methylobacterium sp. E-025]|uniref:hypothetical protein n=1 Tax=Methylobacterium sp. E-025 TaxID=2836561 RepID=UPI001FBB4C27|nr:hypothetical protein [Methylobacterium sp. E-025]MCJ2111896.1 hypothetical protein [Methylobacterium sp. E-025]